MKAHFSIAILLASATALFAHSGVKDPQVMARMQLMSKVADDMKALGQIAKGQAAFDRTVVEARGKSLAGHAAEIEAFFQSPASDPKSEAKPEIWSKWDLFLGQAMDMKDASDALAMVSDENEFQTAFRAVGQTCSACHEDFRIKVD